MDVAVSYTVHPKPGADGVWSREWEDWWTRSFESIASVPMPSPASTVKIAGEVKLPVVPAGSSLSPGEVYLDLRQPERGPFRALEGQTAGTGNCYIAQGTLPAELWNQLVQVCAQAGSAMSEAREHECPSEITIMISLEPAHDAYQPAA